MGYRCMAGRLWDTGVWEQDCYGIELYGKG